MYQISIVYIATSSGNFLIVEMKLANRFVLYIDDLVLDNPCNSNVFEGSTTDLSEIENLFKLDFTRSTEGV